MPELPRISEAFTPVSIDDWRARVTAELGDVPIEALSLGTLDGLVLEPIYDAVPETLSRDPSLERLLGANERPGPLPCPMLEVPDVVAANACLRADIEQGARAAFIRLGTNEGVRVVTATDLASLFDRVDLERVSVLFDPGKDTVAVVACLAGLAQGRDVPLERLRGCFGMDPLGTLGRSGSLPAGLSATMVHLADMAAWASQDLPHVRSVMVRSSAYHDAGATIVQEIAWALATGLEYARKLVSAGLSIDQAAKQLTFAFAVDGRTFLQAAKLRAARLLFGKLMLAAGASPEAAVMQLHAESSLRARTQRGKETNLVRGAVEAMGAVLGLADTVAIAPHDHLFGAPSMAARRLALNAVHILHHEAHADVVRDAAAGSYLVEHLTDMFARAAYDALQEIERGGGFARVLLSGRISRALAEMRARRREAVATGQYRMVGVTDYPDQEELPPEVPVEDRETMRPLFGRYLGDDDDTAVRVQALTVFVAAASSPNTAFGTRIRSAIQAAAAGADFMTIQDSLCLGRPSFHMDPLPVFRAAAPYELLRRRSDRWLKRRRRRPTVVIIPWGPPKANRNAVELAQRALLAGSFEIATADPAYGTDEAASTVEGGSGDVVVLAIADEALAAEGRAIARAIRDAGARSLVVAAVPPADDASLREAGVDHFLYRGANVLSILTQLYDALEEG